MPRHTGVGEAWYTVSTTWTNTTTTPAWDVRLTWDGGSIDAETVSRVLGTPDTQKATITEPETSVVIIGPVPCNAPLVPVEQDGHHAVVYYGRGSTAEDAVYDALDQASVGMHRISTAVKAAPYDDTPSPDGEEYRAIVFV